MHIDDGLKHQFREGVSCISNNTGGVRDICNRKQVLGMREMLVVEQRGQAGERYRQECMSREGHGHEGALDMQGMYALGTPNKRDQKTESEREAIQPHSRKEGGLSSCILLISRGSTNVKEARLCKR